MSATVALVITAGDVEWLAIVGVCAAGTRRLGRRRRARLFHPHRRRRARRVRKVRSPRDYEGLVARWRRRHPSDYGAYIHSAGWETLRARCIELAGGRCVGCGSGFDLQAHHLTYDRLGHERDEDLMCLCRSCHARVTAAQRRYRLMPIAWVTRLTLTAR